MIAALALTALGCPRAPHTRTAFGFFEEVAIPGAAGLRVEFGAADAAVVESLAETLAFAYPRATRWGPFRAPVTVRVYPSHLSLVDALHRRDMDWLRAWATYDEIWLQSPRSWGGAYAERLEELLTHELTHVATYQIASAPGTWKRVDLPLWFREGMASYTADQGGWRGSPVAIGAWLLRYPMHDPLGSPERLLTDHQDAVYAASHWAFEALVDRYGEGKVRFVLEDVGVGRSFAEAFVRHIGMSPTAYTGAWRRDVELLGRAHSEGHPGPSSDAVSD